MVGGVSDHNPPPHASESTGSKITMRVRIGIGILIYCLIVLHRRLVVPWTENLFDVSEATAMLLSTSIALNVCFVIVLIGVITSRRRQNQNSSKSTGSVIPPISG